MAAKPVEFGPPPYFHTAPSTPAVGDYKRGMDESEDGDSKEEVKPPLPSSSSSPPVAAIPPPPPSLASAPKRQSRQRQYPTEEMGRDKRYRSETEPRIPTISDINPSMFYIAKNGRSDNHMIYLCRLGQRICGKMGWSLDVVFQTVLDPVESINKHFKRTVIDPNTNNFVPEHGGWNPTNNTVMQVAGHLFRKHPGVTAAIEDTLASFRGEQSTYNNPELKRVHILTILSYSKSLSEFSDLCLTQFYVTSIVIKGAWTSKDAAQEMENLRAHCHAWFNNWNGLMPIEEFE